MSKFFYQKLAVSNIKKNRKFYFPYLLTAIGSIAVFYIMCFMTLNEGMMKMPSWVTLKMIFVLGCYVIGIFSLIFLFYTNSFLMKRREKELGLFNILGMEKKHIAKIMFYETMFLMVIGIAAGLFCGVLFSKLAIMILEKLLNFPIPFVFGISGRTCIISIVLFSAIFILILLSNLTKIHLSNPIELLKGGNVGEKEPKSKWLIAIIGFICIGAAYYIAITTKSPLDALTLFFFAVMLVIIGTYCLFTAGSIVILKALRKNKKYFYETKHFTSVSGMIYRMKQNAAGLANICILSTMVLVMLSTTISLYIGVDDALKYRYPFDITITKKYTAKTGADKEKLVEQVKKIVSKEGRTLMDLTEETSLSFTVKKDGENITYDTNNYYNSSIHVLTFYTAEDFERLFNKKADLEGREILEFSEKEPFGDEIELFGNTYPIKQKLTSKPEISEDLSTMINTHYIVVADESILLEIQEGQQKIYKDRANQISYHMYLNVDGSDNEKIALSKKLSKVGEYIDCRQAQKTDFYGTYGGFLFLGIFLGTLFIMATVLIIYYKQISEGYDDKERFEIMQKVGMSRHEVKKSIHSQIVSVFFLPLVAAVIHVAAAFSMITKLLAMLNLTNVPLFIAATAGTILVFAIVYALVYVGTARVYYKIVNN